MQSKDAEDDTPANQQTKQDANDVRPLWIRTLQVTVTQLHSLMPKPFQRLKRTAQNIKDPLFRCFEREIATGVRLLSKVTNDLAELIEVCKGNAKQTNYMRSLMNSISKGKFLRIILSFFINMYFRYHTKGMEVVFYP